jgi:hypothetical protein
MGSISAIRAGLAPTEIARIGAGVATAQSGWQDLGFTPDGGGEDVFEGSPATQPGPPAAAQTPLGLLGQVKAFMRGFVSPVVDMVSSPKHLLISAGAIGGGMWLNRLTQGKILPVLTWGSVAIGGLQIFRGMGELQKAQSTHQQKNAWAETGEGVGNLMLSFAGHLKVPGIPHDLWKGITNFDNIPAFISEAKRLFIGEAAVETALHPADQATAAQRSGWTRMG